MNKKLRRLMLSWALILLSVLVLTSCTKKNGANVFTLPSLPQPIAREDVLITSAGQSTDAYIIRDIANQLMIHNYFMPQARETDFKGINTLVLVVGYSPLGAKYHDISFEDERNRTIKLIKKAEENDVPIITVYLGGKQRRGKETDELLKLVSPATDYLIGTKDANYDGFLTELVRNKHIPISLVNGVNEISEPFASAFR